MSNSIDNGFGLSGSVGESCKRSDISEQDLGMLNRLSQNWRLTPATLAYKLSKGSWIPAPWLLYVAQIVASAIAKGGGRIIISAPPRHGKSQLIDIYTPTWVMENFPGYNTILASYGAELSVGFGRQVRDLINENADIMNCRLRKDVKRAEFFKATNGASMMSVGVGGPITGRGANVLLIDDYIKEIKEALSQTYRDYIWDWFSTTAFTRLEPGGTCIIIATRWHSDDLIGRILKTYPGMWTNIVLPALAEKGDILGRDPGEPLFPERYPTEVLMERMEVLGGAYFQALFQQRPIDEANKIADKEWLQYVDIAPEHQMTKTVRVWDLAATKDGGDYTTGSLCTFDRNTGYFYIRNVLRRQMSPGDVENLVQQTAILDGPNVDIGIEREPGSAGKALIEHYQKTVLPEFKVVEISVANKGSKVVRAQPMLAAAEAGKVFLVKSAWNMAFANEFDIFPAGDYDDQVDTVAAAYTLLSGRKPYKAAWGQKSASAALREFTEKEMEQRERESKGQLIRPSTITWGRRNPVA